jgi:hypothetical protein
MQSPLVTVVPHQCAEQVKADPAAQHQHQQVTSGRGGSRTSTRGTKARPAQTGHCGAGAAVGAHRRPACSCFKPPLASGLPVNQPVGTAGKLPSTPCTRCSCLLHEHGDVERLPLLAVHPAEGSYTTPNQGCPKLAFFSSRKGSWRTPLGETHEPPLHSTHPLTRDWRRCRASWTDLSSETNPSCARGVVPYSVDDTGLTVEPCVCYSVLVPFPGSVSRACGRCC